MVRLRPNEFVFLATLHIGGRRRRLLRDLERPWCVGDQGIQRRFNATRHHALERARQDCEAVGAKRAVVGVPPTCCNF